MIRLRVSEWAVRLSRAVLRAAVLAHSASLNYRKKQQEKYSRTVRGEWKHATDVARASRHAELAAAERWRSTITTESAVATQIDAELSALPKFAKDGRIRVPVPEGAKPQVIDLR